MKPHFLIACLSMLSLAEIPAKTIYVDGKAGDDQRDGDSVTAPVRTFVRGVALLEPGDTLSISAEGGPYREMLSFEVKSGTEAAPILVEGNGAVLELGRDVSGKAWRWDGDGWVCDTIKAEESTLAKQRAYGFLQGIPIVVLEKEKPHPYSVERTEEGLLRFYLPEGMKPPFSGFYMPVVANGVTFRKASNITARDLQVRGAQNDGFSFHGPCKNLLIEDSSAVFCGDEGASAHGPSEGTFRRCLFAKNGSKQGGVTDVHASKTNYEECTSAFNRGAGFSLNGAAHVLEKCFSIGNTLPELAEQLPPGKVQSPELVVIASDQASRENVEQKAEENAGAVRLLRMWDEITGSGPQR